METEEKLTKSIKIDDVLVLTRESKRTSFLMIS